MMIILSLILVIILHRYKIKIEVVINYYKFSRIFSDGVVGRMDKTTWKKPSSLSGKVTYIYKLVLIRN